MARWGEGMTAIGPKECPNGRRSTRCSPAPATSAAGSTIEGMTAIGPKECPRSNVLNKFPKSMAPAVTSDLQEIHHAETKAVALAAIAVFTEKYGAKYAPAVACLTRDTEALLTFFDFPAEHWDHLRTSNPVESVFATVRHRTQRTKGALSQKTEKLMAFTLVRAASKTWRRLNGANQLPRVIEGVKFTDGVANRDPAKTSAA